jgi:quercetin dioxygenase-like cupin family protein
MSLLVKGRVIVEIEGYEPQEYCAPTFITIKANDHHKITALEDDTMWFCVFAIRDVDGMTAEDYYSDGNNPRLKMI